MPLPSLAERLRLLVEWSPVLSYATKISNAPNDHEFVLAVADLCAFLSKKTHVEFDDQLVQHITDILRSEEGQAFVQWCRLVWDGLAMMEMPPPEEMAHG